jgi:hypothetical protein
MAFKLYNTPSGGSALWNETKTISVTRGLFTTLLGNTTPLPQSAFNGQELFLGVAVGADPEATPRQRLAHVAYALYAENAGKLAGQAGASYALDSEVPALVLAADGAGSTLDADTIDGLDSATFASAGHSHTGADVVDGSLTAGDLAPDVAPKFINLGPYAAYIDGNTTKNDGFGPYSGIYLPKGTPLGSFAVGFTIPPNYTSGTSMTMRLLWHTASTSCVVDFRGNSISVARPGRNHIVGGFTDDGIIIEGGELLTAPGVANQTNELLVTLTSPDGVTFLEQGDSVIVSLYRRSDSSNDTCADAMVIQAISVTYQ